MERKIISDSFERMLKEKADEFKMYPSARVWHSIYNNMHPGRRWPSLAMSIVLIAVLLLVGYTNSNVATNHTSKTQIAEIKKPLVATSSISSTEKQPANSNSATKISDIKGNSNLMVLNAVVVKPLQANQVGFNSLPEKIRSLQKSTISTAEFSKANKFSQKSKTDNITATSTLSEKAKTEELLKIDNYLTIEENAAIENFSIDNNITSKKENGKFGWQVYATPSVVYHNPSEKNMDKTVDHNDINNSFTQQKPSMGLEVGASVQYALLKKLKLKTGLQLNYTSYVPDYQNLDFDNVNSIYPVTFNNETYQVSLPVGVELKLFGKEKLHWDIGATIQPSYLIGGGNTYLTSSGKTATYIKESSLRNNWNLNAGFETFITYKVNGLTWQLGPQFRYQFNNKNYIFSDNLANYGVKLGVSKALK